MKILVIKSIALMLTVFLTLRFVLVSFLLFFITKFPFKLKLVENLQKSQQKLTNKKITLIDDPNSDETSKKVIQLLINPQQCFQLILDASMSLLLTTVIIDFNQYLAKFAFLISHETHSYFWNTFVIEKQFSHILVQVFNESIQDQIKSFLIWVYILCGMLGLSSQIYLTLDLIQILTLPTKLMFKTLAYLYNKIIKIIKILKALVQSDDQNWITYPYSQKTKKQSIRIISILGLILSTQIALFIAFYYMWLSIIIIFLLILKNLIENLPIAFIKCSKVFFKSQNHPINQKKQVKIYYSVFWVPIFKADSLLKVLKGIDIFSEANYPSKSTKTHIVGNKFNPSTIYFAMVNSKKEITGVSIEQNG